MRFRLGAGQQSSKYRPGQFVSAAYAARYPHKTQSDTPDLGGVFVDEEDYDYPFPDFDWEILVVFDY